MLLFDSHVHLYQKKLATPLGDTSIPQLSRVQPPPKQLCAFRTRLASAHLLPDGQQIQGESTFHSHSFFSSGFSSMMSHIVSHARCVPCVHDSESVPGRTGGPAIALLYLLLVECGSSAIPDAASASAVPVGPRWGWGASTTPTLAKLTAPKTVGQHSQTYRHGTRGPRGEGKRSFLLFPACLHTSKAEPHTGRGFRAGRQNSGEFLCHARTAGGLEWGPTDRGFCSGNRSAGQGVGPTVPR